MALFRCKKCGLLGLAWDTLPEACKPKSVCGFSFIGLHERVPNVTPEVLYNFKLLTDKLKQ
jgi:hypothetical protein